MTCRVSLRLTLLAFHVSLFTSIPLAVWGDATTFQMLSNQRHDAVALGLADAIAVEVGEAPTWEQVQGATRQASARLSLVNRRYHRARITQLLQRIRRLKPGQVIRFDRTMVCTRKGQLVLPGLEPTPGVKRQFGGGTLQFLFENFSPADLPGVSDFVRRAVAELQTLYGAPAQSGTVTIRVDPNLSNLDGGVYNPSTNEISIPPLLFGNFQADALNLLHLLAHAFHGTLQFSFSAWEEGFAHAAGLVVMRRLFPEFDPLDDPFYFIQTYDLWNQPALGNSNFFPPGLTGTGAEDMTVWRIGMAESAWLKVYAENNNFFRQFNQAYYAAFDNNAEVKLSGNVPALKQIAMGIVPTVEGLPFADWYRRQHVLDTSVSVGSKLFVFNFPLDISLLMGIYSFRTDFSGDEVPLAGTADLIYRNDQSDDLFAEEGNETDIVDGVGFISPQFFNIGGANRVHVDIAAGDLFISLVFPYNASGQLGAFNQFFGAVAGSNEGELSVVPRGAAQRRATVSRGVFKIQSLGTTEPTQIRIEYSPTDSGNPITIIRNIGWGTTGAFNAILFFSPPILATFTRTFNAGATGFHFFSLPLTPLKTDEAEVLNIPPNRLLLARHRPEKSGEDKFDLYPNITQPFAPGRAYWLRVLETVTTSIQGFAPPRDLDFDVPLLRGFNAIGVPFNQPFRLSDIRVSFREEPLMTLDDAIGRGLINQGIWGYTQERGFQLVQNTEPLQPFAGYFVRATEVSGVSLVFPAPAPAQSRVLKAQRSSGAGRQRRKGERAKGRRGRRAKGRGGAAKGGSSAARNTPSRTANRRAGLDAWTLKISASAGALMDLDNAIGIAPGATDGFDNRFDIVQPPEIGQFVSLFFPANTGEGQMGRLAFDIRAPFAGQKVWEFAVETNVGGAEVALTWDANSVPRQVKLKLEDVDAHLSRSMSRGNRYTFRAAPNGGARRFRIVASARGGGRRRIVSAIKRQADPGGITFTAAVTEPCQVSCAIFTASGKLVRQLAVNQPTKPGLTLHRWDRRDQLGRVVPHGTYLFQLAALDEDADPTQVVETFRLRRGGGGG